MSVISEISHDKTRAADYAAEIGSRYHRNRIHLAQRLISRNFKLSGSKSFDFGCGEGVMMRWLEGLGSIVSGCDTSQTLIDAAPANAALGGVEILKSLPSSSCDILLALHVLSYLNDAERVAFWTEAPRIIRSGGLILTTAPNIVTGRARWSGEPDAEKLRNILRVRGFEEISSDYIGYFPMVFRWPTISNMTGWNWGPFYRGGRIYDWWRLAMIPRHILAARCVGYYSLARKI